MAPSCGRGDGEGTDPGRSRARPVHAASEESGPNRVLFFEACTRLLNQDLRKAFGCYHFSSTTTSSQPRRLTSSTRFGPLSSRDVRVKKQ